MRKIFTFLFAALMSVGMWAQEESLLTTLTFGESETYGETTSGVVSVTATNVYLYHGTYGWLLAEESSLSVTAKEGYTITKCVFRQNAKTPITDTEAPFEIHTNDWGGIIEDLGEEMNGVTSIEVYGYANAEPDPAKYYIVGSMNSWQVDENYEMNPSLEAETEEYFYTLDLTTTSEFKVVKVQNGQQSWIPEGMGNNYGQNGEITEDGEYTVYFRPNFDGGEDWFYNCIYAEKTGSFFVT